MICRQKQRESERRSRKEKKKNTTEEAIWNGKERDGCSLRIIEGVSRHNRSAWWSDRAGNFFTDGWLHVYILMGSIDRGGKEAEIYKIYTYRDCANTSSIFSFCHVGEKTAQIGLDPGLWFIILLSCFCCRRAALWGAFVIPLLLWGCDITLLISQLPL